MNESLRKFVKSAEGVAFAKYLATEISKLEQVSDIKVKDPKQVAIEVCARQLASERLKEILKEFLGAKATKPPPVDKSEYAIP